MTSGNDHRMPLFLIGLSIVFGWASTTAAPTFDSGSNGSDGSLTISVATHGANYVFNPLDFDPPLDTDGDGVYHFTTIDIEQGISVRLSAGLLGVAPVVWLASGTVQIKGTLDLAGDEGHYWNETVLPANAGAGGYEGGQSATAVQAAQLGSGPGAGQAANAGAGHLALGGAGNGGIGGSTYGNAFLLPLVGGSGGGGGIFAGGQHGAGGGAGGGALLIASSVAIAINGTIKADGGFGGCHNSVHAGHGGGGSGGAIRLIAPTITGSGALTAKGTLGCNTFNGNRTGSPGRIRVEAFLQTLTGTIDPAPSVAAPGSVFLPSSAPSVRVVSVAGVPVPPYSTGSFATPDVTISSASTVTLAIEAQNISVSTIVHIKMFPDTGGPVMADSSPLVGSFDSSTATVNMTIPHGFSRFFIEATWSP